MNKRKVVFLLIWVFFIGCSMPPRGNNPSGTYLGASITGSLHEPSKNNSSRTNPPTDTNPSEPDSEAKGYTEVDDVSKSESTKDTISSNIIKRSTLTAGAHNDNDEIVRYRAYLDKFDFLPARKANVSQRLILQLRDQNGNPIPNCDVKIGNNSRFVDFTSTAAGEVIFFPRVYFATLPDFWNIEVFQGNQLMLQKQVPSFEQIVSLEISQTRSITSPLPVDVLFIFDTTGSMGDEIQRLKDTLFSIHHQISSGKIAIKPRFGMVLYRDVDDAYVTKVHPFTGDLEEFQYQLDTVVAGGGGDEPEELEKALEDSMSLDWNEDGVRLAFIVTDAPPQIRRARKKNYIQSATWAASEGIKIFPIGASGLDNLGEYVLRQIAVLTGGEYIFLTYGETGDSSDSSQAKVSHHTGSNFKTMLLDQMIIEMIQKELSYLVAVEDIIREEIASPTDVNATKLNERIFNAMEQILAQSRGVKEKKVAVFSPKLEQKDEKRLKNVARYIRDGVEELLQQQKYHLLDRENIQTAMKERMVKAGGILDQEDLAEITRIQGADVFLTGKVYPLGQSVVIFLNLVEVQSLKKVAVARVLWTPENI